MNKLLSTLTLLFLVGFVQAQAVRIHVNENTKDGLKPLSDTKFEITMNDTIKTEMTSGSDGMLGKFPLTKGKYRIVIANPEFLNAEVKDVIIEEKKTNSINITCVRISSMSAEEKKKAGIK